MRRWPSRRSQIRSSGAELDEEGEGQEGKHTHGVEAHAHEEATLNLANIEGRVEGATAVGHHVGGEDAELAREEIDLDLGGDHTPGVVPGEIAWERKEGRGGRRTRRRRNTQTRRREGEGDREEEEKEKTTEKDVPFLVSKL